MSTFNNNSGLPEGTAGHHSNRAMNAADPRIDSDMDHRANPTSTTGTTGGLSSSTHAGAHTTGLGSSTHSGAHTSGLGSSTTGTAGAGYGTSGPASHTDGPHKSDMMNKMDPRVDSDRDNSKNMGMNPHGTASTGSSGLGSSTHGTTGTTGLGSSTHGTTGTTGLGSSTHGTTGTTGLGSSTHGPASKTDGPHKSDMMNKADPRVDSDRDHSKNMGMNPHGTASTGSSGLGSSTHGTTGTTGLGSSTAGSTNHGTHNSNALNKADPRFDSDRDHRAAHGTENIGSHGREGFTGSNTTGTTHAGHSTTTGTTSTHSPTTATGHADAASTGPAPKTAGPHKSDLLNKLDPRVDSNLDGSKTIGGNKTFENA